MPSAAVSAIVPTVGKSPWLADCLRALRSSEGPTLEVLLVDQSPQPLEIERAWVDRILRPNRSDGFAAANNLAFTEAEGGVLALVNDDAVVDPGWLETLFAALESDDTVAAVQGVNITLETPPRIDGRGIGWNRWWQAVQIDRGAALETATLDTREVFGVSATAALYRRTAVEAAGLAGGGGTPFDLRLGSYYEDVELAVRLRAAGFRTLSLPEPRVRHAGSTTGSTLAHGARALIYGNRWLVLARLLGRAFWPRTPRILMRDLGDLWQARQCGDRDAAAGISLGLRRAWRRVGAFSHLGPPALPLAELRRFTVR